MDNALRINKHQPIVLKSKILLFVMIVTQLVRIVLISYRQNAPNVNLASTYGREHVNLHVLNLPTDINKISNVLKLVLSVILCKKIYVCNIVKLVF